MMCTNQVACPTPEVWAGGTAPFALSKLWMASPICLRWFAHCVRRAASRAAWTAGNKIAIRIPMIAMTTNSSTSVNPRHSVCR
jgi:hypothetical protein